MRKLNIFFSLAPAPVFLIGAAVSYAYSHHNICGTFTLEMPIMWLIMAAAHISPWLMWWQQRKFQKFQTRPDKQQ
jgi:uncharacterized membrane protein YesL